MRPQPTTPNRSVRSIVMGPSRLYRLDVQVTDVRDRLPEVGPKHLFDVGQGRRRVPRKAGHVFPPLVAHPQREPFLHASDADRFQDPVRPERVTGPAAAGHPDGRPGAQPIGESFKSMLQVAKLHGWPSWFVSLA